MAASASSGSTLLFEALAAADYDGLVQLYGQTAVHALLAHPPQQRSSTSGGAYVRGARWALSAEFGGNRWMGHCVLVVVGCMLLLLYVPRNS